MTKMPLLAQGDVLLVLLSAIREAPVFRLRHQ